MRLSDSELERVATKFRTELEEYCASTHYPTLERFPNGACGDAVLLLGTYLFEIGEAPFDKVCGLRGAAEEGKELPSHAWFERDDLIIDITADQFEDMDEKVIIRRGSEWHKGWRFRSREASYLAAYEHDGSDQLRPVYGVIKEMMGT